MQYAIERPIGIFTEGLIEKDQFTTRMARTKTRIADLDSKLERDAAMSDQREYFRRATTRLRELAGVGKRELATKREIIRTLVQRIDIDAEVIRLSSA